MMPLKVCQRNGSIWYVTVDNHRIASIWQDAKGYHLLDHDGDRVGFSRSLDGITALARRVYDEGILA